MSAWHKPTTRKFFSVGVKLASYFKGEDAATAASDSNGKGGDRKCGHFFFSLLSDLPLHFRHKRKNTMIGHLFARVEMT